MQEQTVLAATLTIFGEQFRTHYIFLAIGFLLHVAVVAAGIGIVCRWYHDMKTWRARGERQHQEDMVASAIDMRRRREEHNRRMTNPDRRI